MKEISLLFFFCSLFGATLLGRKSIIQGDDTGKNPACQCKAAESIQSDQQATKTFCAPGTPCVTVKNVKLSNRRDGRCLLENQTPPENNCMKSKCHFGYLDFDLDAPKCNKNPQPCCQGQVSVDIGGAPIDNFLPPKKKSYHRMVEDMDCGTNWRNLNIEVFCNPAEGGKLLYKRIVQVRCNLCPSGTLR